MNRLEEEHPLPERIKRTYKLNESWYFELRGGGQKGPYDSEAEMQVALQDFIDMYNEVKDKD